VKKVCAAGVTVPGFDVSSYQSFSDFGPLADLGNKFCFIKANESGREDAYFRAHWDGAKAAGLLRGAYCFFHPAQDPSAQADMLSTLVGQLGQGDLPCVIDLETMDGEGRQLVDPKLKAALDEIEAKTGKTPILYVGPYFAEALSLDASFTNYPIWLAEYGPKCPLVPAPWNVWTFWQWSASNGLDKNVFNGPLTQLQKFAL